MDHRSFRLRFLVQFNPEPHRGANAEKDGRDQSYRFKSNIYFQQHDHTLPQFAVPLKSIGQKRNRRGWVGKFSKNTVKKAQMAIICIQVVVYTHSIYRGEAGFHHFWPATRMASTSCLAICFSSGVNDFFMRRMGKA